MDTAALDEILARLPTIPEEQVRVLHASWDGGDVRLRRRAWRHGKALLDVRGIGDLYQGASEQVRRWVNDFASGRTPYELDQTTYGLDRLDLRIAAIPAVLDALLAALVGDELDEDERDELTRPWREAAERPVPVADAWQLPDAANQAHQAHQSRTHR